MGVIFGQRPDEDPSMRDEIARILELAKAGTLTSAQAAEMIAALKDTTSDTMRSDPEAAEERSDTRHRRHHRHRHSRHRGESQYGHGTEHLGEDLQRAIG